jgi:hypothetical protein
MNLFVPARHDRDDVRCAAQRMYVRRLPPVALVRVARCALDLAVFVLNCPYKSRVLELDC